MKECIGEGKELRKEIRKSVKEYHKTSE